ncbi:site-specific integrase [uncultured Aquimarina sp.]|uniref:site-specific integrase n=1 Tax=uncultured Aquimarina sp. TaxID=575652 RepID=UPI0026220A93|nr:site-specific integrase [uncultured Aquimarina sp.]
MATLTLMLDKRNKTAEKFPLVIRVSHKRVPKNISLGYKLRPSDWSESKNQIKSSFENSKRANHKIGAKWTIASKIISEYDASLKTMTVYEIADLIKRAFKIAEEKNSIDIRGVVLKENKTLLKIYGKIVEDRYRQAKRFGTADAIKHAISFVLKYNDEKDIALTEINEIFLEDLESYYLGKGNSLNGLGAHLRAIRRIYNIAIKDANTELELNDYPFGKSGYSIKEQKAKKRAVKIEVIRQIEALDIPKESPLWHHRNYFLVNFYMRGMNFMDMAYLKVNAISNGRLRYKRRKTRRGSNIKEFNILIPQKIEDVFNYYIGEKSGDNLIFPIIDKVYRTQSEEEVHRIYKNCRRSHNRRLETLGKKIKLETKLTTYVARHTFATAGLHKGISKAQVGDMLGHTNYYTTEAYFADFENEILDKAADKIFS